MAFVASVLAKENFEKLLDENKFPILLYFSFSVCKEGNLGNAAATEGFQGNSEKQSENFLLVSTSTEKTFDNLSRPPRLHFDRLKN